MDSSPRPDQAKHTAAKPKAKPKAKPNRDEADAFGPKYRHLRETFMKRLEGVDANVLVSIVAQHGETFPAQFFSDWPDSFSRDNWYKTWGKAEAFVDPADLIDVVQTRAEET